jgi:hypothetical protein
LLNGGQENKGQSYYKEQGPVNVHDAGSRLLWLWILLKRFVLEHQDSMSETELAQKLGISRKCLWERRQRFEIPRKKTAGPPARGRKAAS